MKKEELNNMFNSSFLKLGAGNDAIALAEFYEA